MSSVIEQIQQLAKQVLPQGSMLWLYGSRARGTATKDSDWDLLILLDKPQIDQVDYDNVAYPFTHLGWNIGQQIIPIIHTLSEWQEQSFMPFYQNVEQDKIQLI